jgi:hypothetical protein
MHHPAKSSRFSRSGLNRRKFVGFAGAAAGVLASTHCLASTAADEEQRVLKAGDHVELSDSPEKIIEQAYQLGHAYEKKHGGCARCTVAALQDALPFAAIDEGLFRGATCLDGGATPVGEQNCGGFTGSGMIIGYVCGSRRAEDFHGSAKLAHQLLHKVYHRFAEHYGTVLCRDVRKGAKGNCPEVVGRAARWVAEVLLADFAGYQVSQTESGQEQQRVS